MEMRGGWIVDVDISKFFDTIDHQHLQVILRKRIRDGVLLRLIGKWLHAGVLEGSELLRPGMGTPQGGVISPLLANIYLHEVLDTWVARDVQPRLRGAAKLVRYADDFVIVCAVETDAERVLAVLPKRLGKFGLAPHPTKTRLVRFQRPPFGGPRDRAVSASFDLLGFTHFWAKSRRGNWVVTRKTAKDRLARAIGQIDDWCSEHRHLPIAAQRGVLAKKFRGHYEYYGITGNSRSLNSFYRKARAAWRRWLDRRSNNSGMTFDHLDQALAKRPLPPPRIKHQFA